MAKLCLVIVATVLVGVWAEPPSSYRPPQARNAFSGQYGGSQQRQQGGRSSGSFSYNSLAENQFGGPSRPRSSASTRQQPGEQYGAPAFDDSVVTNARFGQARPGASRGFTPQQRVAPSDPRASSPQISGLSARQQPSSSYAAAARQQPSSQYGAPAAEYGAPLARRNMDDDLAVSTCYISSIIPYMSPMTSFILVLG